MKPFKTIPCKLRHQTTPENIGDIIYGRRYTYDFGSGCVPEWYENSNRPEHLFDYHYHEFIEILIVHSGKMRIVADFGKFTLKMGEILIINCNEVHAGFFYGPEENVDYTFLHINLEFVLDFLSASVKGKFEKLLMGTAKAKNHINEKTAGYDVLMDTVLRAQDRYAGENKELSHLIQLAGAIEILSVLDDFNIIYATKKNTRMKEKDFSIHVLNYIQSNYTKKITTQTVSRFFAYDESQFCRLFKKHFAVSFTHFLNSYRIKMACCYNISDKSMTIDDIAKSVGYDSYSYFCRNFKKYIGKSPKEFFFENTDD